MLNRVKDFPRGLSLVMKVDIDPKVKGYVQSFFNSYAEIFFVKNYYVGMVIFAVTFLNLNVGIAGAISLFSVFIFTKLLDMKDDYLYSSFYLYNPLLVGMSIGYLFRIDPVVVFFIVIAAIFTFMVTMFLNVFFSRYEMPILSLPFSMISSLVYLASYRYSNLYALGQYKDDYGKVVFEWMPDFINFFLKSVSTIIFMPSEIAGALIAAIIFFRSRIMFFTMVFGFAMGVWIESLLLGNYDVALRNGYNFNYILVTAALVTVFLVPTVRSFIHGTIAVAITVILVHTFQNLWFVFKIPVFALPFNIVVIIFVLVFSIIRFKYFVNQRSRIRGDTPEERLDSFFSRLFRFKFNEVNIALPFYEKWKVFQGFYGEWTHKGKWSYAYDFVVSDECGSNFKNSGTDLSDYYCFGKPVLAPVNGTVVAVCDTLVDNQIGIVDEVNNWGNYVVIYCGTIYVVLAHFAQSSLMVKNGDYVKVGKVIGKCGNSGYSPEPHIHIQVQLSGFLGDQTIPFNFIIHTKDSKLIKYSTPAVNEQVEAVKISEHVKTQLSFTLNTKYNFNIFENGVKTDELYLDVRMERSSGSFYLSDGKNKLYFHKEYPFFYFYDFKGKSFSYLRHFFAAMPSLPLFFIDKLSFEEYLPEKITYSKWQRPLVSVLSIFAYKLVQRKGQFKMGEIPYSISGDVPFDGIMTKTKVVLDNSNGPLLVEVGSVRFERII
ncbi:MAG: urea transporter [Bacteriovoracaceae bacterium]|nr:urea transporter [Bacteriovoracaceae bacterium]